MVKCDMKSAVGFVIFVAVVVGLLLLFPGKTYPPIPDDDFHKALGDNSSCMDCHGPGKKNELKKTHPPKFDCLKCHASKAKKART
jgi:hypothetical protein